MTACVYVIAGKDEPLVNAKGQELLDDLLDPEQRMTGLSSVGGDEAEISTVLDDLRTLPFLTDKRVVVVKGADDFISKNRAALERYFEKPSPTGVLVMTVSTWDSRLKLAKKLPQVGKLVAIAQPKRWQLPQHLVQYTAETYKVRLDRDAAGLLVELAGEELAQLYNEVDKLVLFARGQKAIRVEHVESLIGHHRVYGAFEVIDAVVAGDVRRAVERLRNMFEEDRSAEYTVVGAFAFHVRRMFNAKVLLDGGVRPDEAAKRLRIWGNKDRFFAQLRRISLPQIAALLEQLANIDYEVKTGQTQTPIAMEQLVLRLAGAGQASPSRLRA
jgi:DNA polymerase-3 subunit delta